MAPLSQALSLVPEHSNVKNGTSHVYSGVLDSDWASISIPNGGYILGLLVKAGAMCQESTQHPDPIHVTGHFVRPSLASSYRIEATVVRRGSRFSNLVANFIQREEVKVMAHMIFGTLPEFNAPPSSEKYEDIIPSHPLYRSMPMLSHPSASILDQMPVHIAHFAKHAKRAQDPEIAALNRSRFLDLKRTHGGGLEAGIWVELTRKDEQLELAMLPFFADMYERTPTLLNAAHGAERVFKRFPTVLITLEFKRQLPRRGTPGFSHRTLGLYSRNMFLDQGRHDVHCEIWTAPDDIGQGERANPSDESWKEKMKCVAVATQVALSFRLDIDINRHKLGVKL